MFTFRSIRIHHHFSTLNFPYKLNLDYLRKLQGVLGQNFKINEDITHADNVRLIDKNNKFVGVLSMEEAKRKAKAAQLDLVLINSDVQPAICRLIDYSEELGKKFLKEILVTDQDKREKLLQKQTKLLKLGSKISIQDLKVKGNLAQELLKKAKQIRVQIICDKDSVSQSQNILMTFRDLSSSFMTPMSDIRVKDQDLKDDTFTKEDVEPKKVVEWTFRSLDVQFQKQEEYTIEEIKKHIDSHFSRLRQFDNNLNKREKKYAISVEDIKQAKQDFGDNIQDEDDDLQKELMLHVNKKSLSKAKKKKVISSAEYNDDLMKILGFSSIDQLLLGQLQVQNEFEEYKEVQDKNEEKDKQNYVFTDYLSNGKQVDQKNTQRLIKILKDAKVQKI